MYSFIHLFILIIFCFCLNEQLHSTTLANPTDSTSTSYENISTADIEIIQNYIEATKDEKGTILPILKEQQLNTNLKGESEQDQLDAFKKQLETFILNEKETKKLRRLTNALLKRVLQPTTDKQSYLKLVNAIVKQMESEPITGTHQTQTNKSKKNRIILLDLYATEVVVKTFDPAHKKIKTIPKDFDARNAWENCAKLIGTSIDQGNYPNDWASATCGAFADRICIKTDGQFKETLSVEELSFCCDECLPGRFENYTYGDKNRAWEYFQKVGAVTGGDYINKGGCQPYKIKPCINSKGKNTCEEYMYVERHECSTTCYGDPTKNITEDRHYASNAYHLFDIETAQKDIMTYGPITATFLQPRDFFSHQIGAIYKKPDNYTDWSDSQVVKIIGWGEDSQSGQAYWLCVHTYGNFWGKDGTFKIAKGSNECKIEEYMFAGEAS